MQIMTWVLWGLLLTGAALVFGDLWRNAIRYREWRRIRAAHDGEIVLDGDIVQVGQAIRLLTEADGGGAAGTLPGAVAAIEKRLLTLALDQPLRLASGDLQRGSLSSGGVSVWPTLGAMLAITVTAEDALYRFSAPVRDVRVDVRKPGQRLLVVERPTWMARIQRRQHIRTPMQMAAAFERAVEPNAAGHTMLCLTMPGTVVELSAGGFQADIDGVTTLRDADTVSRSFTPGTLMRVRLDAPALAQSPLLARVRSCGKVTVRGGFRLRIACEFLPMASWEQELLVQYVFRAQRDWLQERARARKTAA